jgi:hypothetical protein
VDKLKSLADFQIGEMKFPETRIGEAVTKAGDWLSQKVGELEVKQASSPAVNIAKQVVQFAETHWPKPGDEAQPSSGQRLKVPLPPRIRPKPIPRQGRK